MSMTVSSETMHENHNQDAAYDSVDIPLSLFFSQHGCSEHRKELIPADTGRRPPLLRPAYLPCTCCTQEKRCAPTSTRPTSTYIHTHKRMTPVHTLNDNWRPQYICSYRKWKDTCGRLNLFISRTCPSTQWNTHSERTHVAGWTCSFYSIHTHSEKHVQTCRPKKKDYRIIPW